MAKAIVSEKLCKLCSATKPASEFYRRKGSPDGLQWCCKACDKARMVRERQTDDGRAKCREWANKYNRTEKGKANRQAYQKSRRGTLEVKARNAVGNAVKANEMPRAKTLLCACGKPAQQYHHHLGYEPEHWLHVLPVCVACHGLL